MAAESGGCLQAFVNNFWNLGVLVAFMLGGTVIFMGIEGNHIEFIQYKYFEEQYNFNKSLEEWIETASAENSSYEYANASYVYDFESNYTKLLAVMYEQCQYAHYNLSTWDEKSDGDALMFAISVVSTVGWGVYSPPTDDLRLAVIIYAIFGLPLFGAVIGIVTEFVGWTESSLADLSCTRKYIGNAKAVSGLLLVGVGALILIYYGITHALEAAEKDGIIGTALDYTGGDYEWTAILGLYYTIQTVATIGFGDIYIYSPEEAGGHHSATHTVLKPFLCFFLTLLLIGIFSHLFSKMQENVEKNATKDVRRANVYDLAPGYTPNNVVIQNANNADSAAEQNDTDRICFE